MKLLPYKLYKLLEMSIIELQKECQNVLSLINQLQLSELSVRQKGQILSELLVASIDLHSHCDEDLQNLISDEIGGFEDFGRVIPVEKMPKLEEVLV